MDKTTKQILSQILNSYKEPSLLLEGSDIVMAYGISEDEALLIKDNVLEKARKKAVSGITSFSIKLEEQEYVVFLNTIKLEGTEYKHLVLEKTEINETDKSEKNEFESIINSVPGQIFKLSKKSNKKIILSFFHGNLVDDMGLSTVVHNGLELGEILRKLNVSTDYLDYYYKAFEGQSSRHEVSISSYFLEIYLSPFKFNSDGEIIEILGIVDDITDKVKYRLSLEESEKRFRLLFANENISKILVDIETQKIIDANRSAIKLFGYGEKLKGMNIYDLNTELRDSLPELLKNLDNFSDNKFIVRVLTPAGKEIFIEIYITALNFADKTIAKLTILDVTDRIEAETQVKDYIDEVENRNIEIQNRNEEIQAINEELRTTTEDLEHTLRDLNKSNENLKAIFNSSFDAILILDKELNIVDLNDRAVKYFVMSREHLINTSAMNLISPENKNIFVKLKQEIDDHGVSQHVIKNKQFNNNIQFAEVRAAKFEFESRDNYIIMIRDVTEITLANKNLQQSNNRHQFLIKHNPNVIYTLDPITMQLTYITENIYDQMGYHPNDIIGKVINSVRFVHEEDLPIFEKNLSILMNQGFAQCEYRFKDSHGHYNWILNKVTLISDENNEPKEILGTWIDITSRKFAEDELNLLNQRFEFLLKHSPAIIYTLEPSGNFESTYITKNVEDKLGFKQVDFIKNPDLWINRIHPKDVQQVKKGIFHTFKNGNYSHSYRFIDADGKIKWLHDEQRLLYNKDNQPAEIIGSVLDVTNLKENEQKLIELNATKDKFFSIIAHDLKSPISGILNLTGLMAQEFNKLSIEQLLDISTKLYKSSISFNKLLENLLLWSRLSRGGIEFNPQYITINLLIENTLHLLDNSIKSKEINVINNLNGTAQAFIDENMIETVLRNLISNAIKFTPKKGEIEITAAEIGRDMIEITIRDSGIGIKAENIDKLFGIDTKYSTRGTDGESGTGLGLIICKEFIDRHAGNIYIISAPDKGTRVKFSLPTKKTNFNVE